MVAEIYHWVLFNIMILGLLTFDLWYHRKSHQVTVKEALIETVIWIALALSFNGWLYYRFGDEPALNFFTGYLIEKSLSLDNLFIFLLIFSHFRVPEDLKHRVLFYGILGAIIMRALLILGGVALIHYFDWIFYLFGAFLVFTGFRMAFKDEEIKIEHEKNLIYRLLLASRLPMIPSYYGEAFFIKKDGRWTGTLLLLVLIIIETTDLIFALDSIPAILAITTDPFIVYTSNLFAILGLRSLFFVIEGIMKRFYLFHYALAAILVFTGFKMLLMDFMHISTGVTLTFMIIALTIALVGSILFPKKSE